ncbi:triose-phosphate isomerase family protein [Enterococcus sp. LJL90]
MTTRKPIVGMSWAMRQNRNQDAVDFAKQLVDLLNENQEIEQIVFPSMGTITAVATVLKDSRIGLGSQNIASFAAGEYSGEYSIESLVDVDGQYVELGHWERRSMFGDTDELINKKLLLTLEAGLTPVLCIGEDEKIEDPNKLYSILKRQLFNDLQDAKEADVRRLVVAYTPHWAVGKTRASNAPHIHQVGQVIREILAEFYPAETVAAIRVIYGGSVSPENARLIVADDAIDGVLVGRFGSEPRRYAEVVAVVEEAKGRISV